MVDKPAGMTSHDVVATVRRRFDTRAVGHTGTLDPFATGLLVLVLGGATRLARFVEGERKTYTARARLGFATTTDDATGSPLGSEWTGPWPASSEVERALAELVGTAPQLPPAYSAKQVGGLRSHAVARRGGTLALEPAEVTVHSVALLDYRPPVIEWRATVGPGTYLRAMARDLGVRLGTGAHLEELRRERVGRFAVAEAFSLTRLTGKESLIAPLDLLAHLARVEVSPDEVARLRQGQRVGTADGTGPTMLVSGTELVAVAEPRDGQWQPVVVLAA